MGSLANRLRKNRRHFGKWARRRQITCYRIYDHDIPQWPLSVDHLGDEVVFLRLGDRFESEQQQQAIAEVADGLDCELSRIWWEQRPGELEFVVEEAGHRFLLRVGPQHDAGLFLDHRITRALVAEACPQAAVLNLFCYTGSFSVYAAAAGARHSLAIDLSAAHLRWARKNFELNAMGQQHLLERHDVMKWLDQQEQQRWDVVVCDPPTFSRSKSMEGDFDVQRDHQAMLEKLLGLTLPGGRLYFSTNYRRFKMASELDSVATEITSQTTTEDFRRRPAHRCWLFQK